MDATATAKRAAEAKVRATGELRIVYRDLDARCASSATEREFDRMAYLAPHRYEYLGVVHPDDVS